MKVIPTIIGCLGGGMKEVKESIRRIFEYDNNNNNNNKELKSISREIRQATLWESKSLIKKSVMWTVDMMCFNLTNRFW